MPGPRAWPTYLHADSVEGGEEGEERRAGPPGPRARPAYLHADSAEGGEEGRRGEQARQVPELDPPTFMLILRRGVRRGGEASRPARSQSLTSPALDPLTSMVSFR